VSVSVTAILRMAEVGAPGRGILSSVVLPAARPIDSVAAATRPSLDKPRASSESSSSSVVDDDDEVEGRAALTITAGSLLSSNS
jgi:hypothetical protein